MPRQAFLNRPPNAAYKALLEMGFQQDMVYPGRRGLFQNILVGIAGNENDWGVEVAVP